MLFLDVRLKKFNEEKQQLQSEVQHLQEQLETYKSQGKGRGKNSSSNGPLGSDDDDYEAQSKYCCVNFSYSSFLINKIF